MYKLITITKILEYDDKTKGRFRILLDEEEFEFSDGNKEDYQKLFKDKYIIKGGKFIRVKKEKRKKV